MLSCTTVGLSARHPTYFVFWTLMLQLSFFEVQMVEDKSHQRVNSPHSEDDLCLLWHINLSASTCSYGIRIQLLRQLVLMCLLCAFMHFDPMMLQRVFKLLGVATSAILLQVTFIGPQNNPWLLGQSTRPLNPLCSKVHARRLERLLDYFLLFFIDSIRQPSFPNCRIVITYKFY